MTIGFRPDRRVLPPPQQAIWNQLAPVQRLGLTDDGVLQVASLDDLLGTKLKVILQRVEAKDYVDIAAMIAAGMSLAHGLAVAKTLFGGAFQPSESLKALTWFEGGDLETLPQATRSELIGAASAVRDLPRAPLADKRLAILDR